MSCHTLLALHVFVGVAFVGDAGDCQLRELGFVCFHGCPVSSKFLFVYLFQLISFCQPDLVSIGL